MRALDDAYTQNPPLIHAAGHDHNLQLFAAPEGTPHIIVSGSGTVARPDPVWYGDETVVASPFAGFMRVDALHDGRVRLEIIEVDEEGGVRRPWSTWLRNTDERASPN